MSLNGWLALAALLLVLLSPLLLLASPLLIWCVYREVKRRRRDGYSMLLPFMVRTLTLAAPAMIRSAPPAAGWETIARTADRYLALVPLTRRWRALLVIVGLQLLPLLHARRPFTWMSDEQRRSFVDGHLSTTRGLGGLVGLARQLVRMGYYQDPSVQQRIGFREVGLRSRGRTEARQRALHGVGYRGVGA